MKFRFGPSKRKKKNEYQEMQDTSPASANIKPQNSAVTGGSVYTGSFVSESFHAKLATLTDGLVETWSQQSGSDNGKDSSSSSKQKGGGAQLIFREGSVGVSLEQCDLARIASVDSEDMAPHLFSDRDVTPPRRRPPKEDTLSSTKTVDVNDSIDAKALYYPSEKNDDDESVHEQESYTVDEDDAEAAVAGGEYVDELAINMTLSQIEDVAEVVANHFKDAQSEESDLPVETQEDVAPVNTTETAENDNVLEDTDDDLEKGNAVESESESKTGCEAAVVSSQNEAESDGRVEEKAPVKPDADGNTRGRSPFCFLCICILGLAIIGASVYAGISSKNKDESISTSAPSPTTSVPSLTMAPSFEVSPSPNTGSTSEPTTEPSGVPTLIPETELPTTECVDTKERFDIDGKKRDCEWLASQSAAFQLTYCQPSLFETVKEICPATCNNC
jgi:hypothetical protein